MEKGRGVQDGCTGARANQRAGWPSRGGGPRAVRARARLARILWSGDGMRRLPGLDTLDGALEGLRRGDIEWICEFGAPSPLYLLPTRRWIGAMARTVRELGARRVLEVAAGDGFLSRCLASAAPELEVTASDSGAWEKPQARMSARERRDLRGISVPGLPPGPGVVRLGARAAIRRFRPDLVLAAWLPPGPMLESLIRAPVPLVLDIGATGATPGAWHWRWAHEILDGPLETLARCRLDERPRRKLHSRATLYYGAAHPQHGRERVRRGDWLWQFRPAEELR